MNSIFPTLFSKTFFILSAQLFITWLTTQGVFWFFARIDPSLGKGNPYMDKSADETVLQRVAADTDPRYQWVFSSAFFNFLLIVDAALFLALIFWGEYQGLRVSFSLFSAWSILTGIELEYALLNVEEGLGRKVIALTAIIVLAAGLIGIYSHINFGFLGLPLFIALSGLVLFGIVRMFVSISELGQRIYAGIGALIFTFYLVFDFNRILQNANRGYNNWPNATDIAINLYLDIINLILHLLSFFGKHHH